MGDGAVRNRPLKFNQLLSQFNRIEDLPLKG